MPDAFSIDPHSRPGRFAKPAGILLMAAIALKSVPAFGQVDFSGLWANRYHEDQEERGPGGPLGDYTGIPLNDAARLKADTWDAALYGLPEWECRPHSSENMWRSVHPARIYKDVDTVTGETIAFNVNFHDLIDRVIYLDGRPHPPEEAAHTWAGFSTGKWEGDMLTVTTTHIKEYLLKRDGVPVSDLSTMVEHWIRHGDYLTVVQIVTDPVYLTEPYIQSTDFVLDLHLEGEPPQLCEIEEETDRPKNSVPHRLPGTMNDSEEFAKKYGLPVEAVRGGAETTYPEYRKKIKEPIQK
jgi:hypothetical protein